MAFDIIGFEREAIKRKGFSEFVRRAFRVVEPGKTYREQWYHKAIAERCERASYSDGGRERMFGLCLPPATLKSTIGSVLWPAWHWATIDPSHGILGASYDHRLAVRDSKKMLELVQSDWYRGLFPHVWVPDACGVTEYANTAGGFRLSASMGGKITGRHPRLRIIDDPTKPIRANTEALDQQNIWYGSTWASRADEPTKVLECLIMQRLHPADMAGHLKNLGHSFFTAGAEYRSEVADALDPRTVEGELLDAERLPQDLLETLKISMGEDFEIQYNQNPKQKTGNMFDRANIRLVDVAPDISQAQASCISVDCSFKNTEDSDYISIQVWYLVKGVFYLVDCVDTKADFVETLAALRDIIRKHPKVYLKLIEDKANGPAVISVFKQSTPGIHPVNPLGGKIDRANSIAPVIRTGSVAVLRGRPWTERFLHQVHHFPRAPNDDHVDAMGQAIAHLMMNGYGIGDVQETIDLDLLREMYS